MSRKMSSSSLAKKQSKTSRKMSASLTAPITSSPSASSPRCLRCSSVGVSCDGKQPCAPCAANNGGRACCYTGASAVNRNRERQHSTATSTVSVMTSEDGEGSPWSNIGQVPRRHTASSIASSINTDLTSPMLHSFNGLGLDFSGHMHQQPFIQRANSLELPSQHFAADLAYTNVDANKMMQSQQLYDENLLQAVAMHNLYPLLQNNGMTIGHQTTAFDYDVTATATAEQASSMYAPSQQQELANMTMLDWNSLTSTNGEAEKLPFTGTASDKSLSATLFSDEFQHQQSHYQLHRPDSVHSSPAVHSALHSALLTTTALPSYNAQSASSQADFSSLGLHIPQPLHLSLPSNNVSNMSADNWDGLLRTLSSQAVNRSAGETVVA